MSIKVIEHVIEKSPHRGSELLLLIVLGRYVNDDGTGAYPRMDTLAKYARLTRRATGYALAALVASGAVTVEIAAGPQGVNRYAINLGMVTLDKKCPAGVRRGQRHVDAGFAPKRAEETYPPTPEAPCTPEEDFTLHSIAPPHAIECIPPMQNTAGGDAKQNRGGMQNRTENTLYIDPVITDPVIDPVIPPLPPEGEPRARSGRKWDQDDQDRFNAFWKIYPAKKSKEDALKWWKRQRPQGETYDRIMAGVRAQLAADPGFASGKTPPCPYPATWLNGKKWEDELDAPDAGDMFNPENYPRRIADESGPDSRQDAPGAKVTPEVGESGRVTRSEPAPGELIPELVAVGVRGEDQPRFRRVVAEAKLAQELRLTFYVPANEGQPAVIIFTNTPQKAVFVDRMSWARRGKIEAALRHEYGHGPNVTVRYIDLTDVRRIEDSAD